GVGRHIRVVVPEEDAAGSVVAGPDAAEDIGAGDLPGSTQGRIAEPLADPDVNGARRRSRPRGGIGNGRGRLRDEAIQPEGIDCASEGVVAAGRAARGIATNY